MADDAPVEVPVTSDESPASAQPIDWLVPHIKKTDIKLYQALKSTADTVVALTNYVNGLKTTQVSGGGTDDGSATF
jgi:hypothetical protein